MKTALLVSNRLPDESGGRAEKVATRVELMAERGWRVVVGHAPEPYVRGFPSALLGMCRLARREDPDLVVSINNPFHLHLHGYLVARYAGVPWLAELRDPIAAHPDRAPTSPRTWGAHAVERLVVREADQVVWHDGIQIPEDYFAERYPDVPAERFFRLPVMGYERATFETAPARKQDAFTVTYAGSFYEGWIEPYTFLEGLGAYREAGGDPLRAQFYGDWNEDYARAATEAGVTDWVETHEFVPHEEIVPVLKGADVLLYVGGDDPGNRLNLPSKLWDYVGARTPILAVVDPSFRVAEFLRDHRLGVVVEPGDAEGIAAALRRLRAGEFGFAADADVERFSREHSADVLAQVFDAVADGRNVVRATEAGSDTDVDADADDGSGAGTGADR
jgi:glycosyltransferase involved in cell wall biosynthesis